VDGTDRQPRSVPDQYRPPRQAGRRTIVTGGTIVRPAAGALQGTLAKIDGGVTRKLAKGDAILIPEGTPHWYSGINGAIAYLEVRFSVPTK